MSFIQPFKKWSNLAPLEAFLSMIEDVPENYTVVHFKNEIIEMLVARMEETYHRLKPQLHKSLRSYQDLIADLHANKPMHSGIDFYIAAARLFIGKPVLVLKPELNKDYDGSTGPHYVFKKEFLIEEDKYIVVEKINIKLVFNGINYYAPFYTERIASLMREGLPVMRDIIRCYDDVTSLIRKLPEKKSINSGMRKIQLHLEAAAAVCKTTKLSSGYSNPYITDIAAPGMNPLISGVVRKRKHKKDAKDSSEQPEKRSKGATPGDQQQQQQQQVLSLAEHEAELDKTYEERHPSTQAAEPGVTQPESTERQEQAEGDTQAEGGKDKGQGEEDESDSDENPSLHPGPTQCVCGETLPTEVDLKLHAGLMHKNNAYTCAGKWIDNDGSTKQCTHEAQKPGSIWKHYRTQHLGVWYYYCAVEGCKSGHNGGKYGADSAAAVKKHMFEIHKVPAELVCPKEKCQYVGGSRFKLREHIQRCGVDRKIKFYQCEKCPKGFREKEKLTTHMRQIHPAKEGDMSAWHHCGYCEKKFQTVTGRRKHWNKAHSA